MTIPQHVWEGLDGDSRQATATRAKAKGVLIYTAALTNDKGLTAEVYK